jgi:hypothetical protein
MFRPATERELSQEGKQKYVEMIKFLSKTYAAKGLQIPAHAIRPAIDTHKLGRIGAATTVTTKTVFC